MGTRFVRSVRAGLALLGVCVVVAAGLVVWTHLRDPAAATEDSTKPDGRQITLAKDELFRQAEERLVKRCMTRHGFAYVEQPPASPITRSFPYVVDDVAWARKYGFGGLAAGPDAWGRDANDVNLHRLAPDRQRAWMDTLMGSGRQLTADLPEFGRVSMPDNGCTAEARRTLYRDLAGWYKARRVVDHLGTYIGNQVRQNARYRSALATWAKCVRRRGYPADTPDQLRELVTSRIAGQSGDQAHATEVAAAEIEAACAKTTGLTKTIRSLEKSYRPQVERRFARERKALESYERQAVPRARQILAGS